MGPEMDRELAYLLRKRIIEQDAYYSQLKANKFLLPENFIIADQFPTSILDSKSQDFHSEMNYE